MTKDTEKTGFISTGTAIALGSLVLALVLEDGFNKVSTAMEKSTPREKQCPTPPASSANIPNEIIKPLVSPR